jgi:hypothetical protein
MAGGGVMSADLFRSVLAQFSGAHSVIAVQRSYIDFAGDLPSGVLLSQMIYWSSRRTSKDGWFYKTYAEWHEEIYLPEKTVRRYADSFEKRGFLDSKVCRNAQNLNVRHYRIDWDALAAQMQEHFSETPADKGTGTLGGLEADDSDGSGKSMNPVPPIYTSTITSISSSKEPENFSEQPEETKPSPVNQAPIVETSNPTALKGKTTPLPPSYMSLLPAKPDRPWKTGNGGNDWNEEFVQAILVYLKGLPNSEGKTRADAINWISVRQNLNHEAHDSLWARWEEFKAKKKAPAKMTDEEFNDLSLRSIARNDAKTAFIRSCGLKGTFALDAWDALPTAERKILYRQHYEILKSA